MIEGMLDRLLTDDGLKKDFQESVDKFVEKTKKRAIEKRKEIDQQEREAIMEERKKKKESSGGNSESANSKSSSFGAAAAGGNGGSESKSGESDGKKRDADIPDITHKMDPNYVEPEAGESGVKVNLMDDEGNDAKNPLGEGLNTISILEGNDAKNPLGEGLDCILDF
jgi:hypothetical protein